jgi:type I restriction enzyme M protein
MPTASVWIINSMKRDVLFIERSLKLLKPGGRMAIVLPQGILNNMGTEALRRWIRGKARILAVVGLPYFTFRPFASIKTSVLLLQKWGGEAGRPVADYNVFLGVNEKSCKDNRGNYIYKRDSSGNLVDDDGVPVIESNRPAAIDHDLGDIADAFKNWALEEQLSFALD